MVFCLILGRFSKKNRTVNVFGRDEAKHSMYIPLSLVLSCAIRSRFNCWYCSFALVKSLLLIFKGRDKWFLKWRSFFFLYHWIYLFKINCPIKQLSIWVSYLPKQTDKKRSKLMQKSYRFCSNIEYLVVHLPVTSILLFMVL